jgi:hypothetical protein
MSNLIDRQAAIDIVEFECGEWSGLAKTIAEEIKQLPPAQPTPDQNGDLWITVPDIDKVTCIYVQESKSKFCRIFYEEQEQSEPYKVVTT